MFQNFLHGKSVVGINAEHLLDKILGVITDNTPHRWIQLEKIKTCNMLIIHKVYKQISKLLTIAQLWIIEQKV